MRDRTSIGRWWTYRQPRERVLVMSAALLLAAAVIYLLLWEPMKRDIERLHASIARTETLLPSMKARAEEIQVLRSKSSSQSNVKPIAGRTEVDAELRRAGIAASIDPLESNRLRLRFDAVNSTALINAMQAIHRTTKLRITELTAAARVEPGLVRAEFILGP